MDNKYYKQMFLAMFDDDDIVLESGNDDKKEQFISIYTLDSGFTRSLLTKTGLDPFKGHEAELGEYAETYDLDFYTEYHPNTENVALKYVLNIYDMSISDSINQITADNTKDGYVILTPELENGLKEAVVDFLRDYENKHGIHWTDEIKEFMELD